MKYLQASLDLAGETDTSPTVARSIYDHSKQVTRASSAQI